MPPTEETPTRTRPARKRATPAATKPAVAAPAAVEPDEAEESTRITFAMDRGEETKTYGKFQPPKSSGCVGTLYVPKGVTEVKVLMIGPATIN